MLNIIDRRDVRGTMTRSGFNSLMLNAVKYNDISEGGENAILFCDYPIDTGIIVATDVYCCSPAIMLKRTGGAEIYNDNYTYGTDPRFPSLLVYRETDKIIEAYFLDNLQWNTSNVMYTYDKETKQSTRSKHIDTHYSNDGVDFLERLINDLDSRIYIVE